MKSKYCYMCGSLKERRSNGYCKECNKIVAKRNRNKHNDGYWYVYYLPEEHYIGITSNLYTRRIDHNRNKITEGMEIIAKFERAVDAAWFEILLQQRGYNGFQY